jgi:cell division protein YceG involved in septum cleavage
MNKEIMMISEVKTYVDDKGKEVRTIQQVNEDTLDKKVLDTKYTCKGIFGVMTNMGPIQMVINFPEGYTVKQCFEEFDKFAQETVDAKKRELMDKSKIAVPNTKGGIIMP